MPPERIIELDWNDSARVAGLELIATPARHFSGRGLHNGETLWASWVIKGTSRRAFYSGDTGYFPGFTRIGAEHGPFDVTLIQVGAYLDGLDTVHMVPERGVITHLDVRGGLLIPVHWATFDLSVHPWADPAERTWRAAKDHDVPVAIPRPGQLSTSTARRRSTPGGRWLLDLAGRSAVVARVEQGKVDVRRPESQARSGGCSTCRCGRT